MRVQIYSRLFGDQPIWCLGKLCSIKKWATKCSDRQLREGSRVKWHRYDVIAVTARQWNVRQGSVKLYSSVCKSGTLGHRARKWHVCYMMDVAGGPRKRHVCFMMNIAVGQRDTEQSSSMCAP
jgi:hypothetical protein